MFNQETLDVVTHSAFFDVEAARAQRLSLDQPPQMPIGDAVRVATRETGSGTSWLSGFWRCLNGPGKLSAAEYFYYKLYENQYDDEARVRFVGKTAQARMHKACCDTRWFAVATDKLLFLSMMRGAGIPVPETLAVFDATGRRTHAHMISSVDGMMAFLNNPRSYPLFAKPIDGMYSIGAFAMTDGGHGMAHVPGAGNVSVREIADYMQKLGSDGYLLQRTLLPATVLADAFGGALATVRFLVLNGKAGPKIESAVIKIPKKGSIADNYWRDGNMLGALDADSGQITRVVAGSGATLSEVSHHPDTEAALIGLQLPDWHAARAMCERAAGTLPGLGTQSWDIALTPKGPVVMEVNWGGDSNLHQLAHGRGALTATFAAHLRRHGYEGKLPLTNEADGT